MGFTVCYEGAGGLFIAIRDGACNEDGVEVELLVTPERYIVMTARQLRGSSYNGEATGSIVFPPDKIGSYEPEKDPRPSPGEE